VKRSILRFPVCAAVWEEGLAAGGQTDAVHEGQLPMLSSFQVPKKLCDDEHNG
jgi:hypothetical protein